MEYRATGYILPPPSLLSTSHHGLHVPDGPDHLVYQRQSPITHSPTSLLHDVSPLSKSHFTGYDRIDHSSTSRLPPHKSTLAGQTTIKTAQQSSKSRPPRRSSANGVVACRQWYVVIIYSIFSADFDPSAVGLAKSDAIRLDQDAKTVRGDQLNANTTRSRSGEAPTKNLERGDDLAKNGL